MNNRFHFAIFVLSATSQGLLQCCPNKWSFVRWDPLARQWNPTECTMDRSGPLMQNFRAADTTKILMQNVYLWMAANEKSRLLSRGIKTWVSELIFISVKKINPLSTTTIIGQFSLRGVNKCYGFYYIFKNLLDILHDFALNSSNWKIKVHFLVFNQIWRQEWHIEEWTWGPSLSYNSSLNGDGRLP